MITSLVREFNSDLCDGEIPDKMNYATFRNFSFAYVHACKAIGRSEKDSYTFWATDIYDIYRSHDEHDKDSIWRCLWNSTPKGHSFSIKSLHKWAKDHEEYDSTFSVKEEINIDELLTRGDDLDIAEIIYHLYGESIVMTDVNTGYYFDPNSKLWIQAKKPVFIFNLVSDKLLQCAKECKDRLLSRISKAPDDKGLKKSLDKLNATMKRIRSDSTISKVISRLTKFTYNEKFQENINGFDQRLLFPISCGRVVDLKTGLISERTMEHMFDFESCVNVDLHDKQGDIFAEKFFLDLANGNKELADYLAKITLYFCSGSTFDRSFFQLIGKGRNGKSTYLNMLQKILQNTFITGEKQVIITDPKNPSRGNSGAQPGVLMMRNKRVVAFTETEHTDKLNCSMLKNLSGNDLISARALYSNVFEQFMMTGKLLIASNNVLEFHTDDPAVKSRFRYVRFDNTFDVNEKFMFELMTPHRLSQIFSYCLKKGSSSILQENIDIPNCVVKSTSELFEDMDTVGTFIKEEYIMDNNKNVSCTAIYSDYVYYCTINGSEKLGRNKFYQHVEERGFKKTHCKTGNVFVGLSKSTEQ
jgi:P4 family phage/plasmid primase-like protien